MEAGDLLDFAMKQRRVLVHPIQRVDMSVEDFGDLMSRVNALKDESDKKGERKRMSGRG